MSYTRPPGQQAYPPQQQGYPPQQPYPPQQQPYPPQQQPYPPQQQPYPPQQQPYPPQQGFPPQYGSQGSFQGYPQQQGSFQGYPQQQGSFQGYPPQQQGSFQGYPPQQQGSFQGYPSQTGYPQQGGPPQSQAPQTAAPQPQEQQRPAPKVPLRPNEPVQRSQTVPTFSQQPAFGKSAALKSAPVLDDKLDDEEAMKERMTLFYRVVMTDPRYLRIVKRLAPSTFSMGKLKQQVDPSKIPVFGTVVKGYRSARIEKHKDQMEIVQGGENPSQMNSTLNTMQINMGAEATKRHIGLAVGLMFTFIPVAGVGAATVGSSAGEATAAATASATAGYVAAKGAEKGTEEAVKKGAQKAGERAHLANLDKEDFDTKIHGKFTKTKAFLTYLGPTGTDDELYSRWEPFRLRLKKLYGSSSDDDLPSQEPAGEVKKKLEAMEKTGAYDLDSLGVSLLWILWRMYECWDTYYFGYLDEHRHITKKGRQEWCEEQKAIERQKDIDYLASLSLEDHPFVRRVHKSQKDMVVGKLVKVYYGHPALSFLDEKDKDKDKEKEEKTIANFKWYFGLVADYFFKEQEIWGVEDPTTLEILAIALIEPPKSPPAKISMTSGAAAMAKATKQMGTKRVKEMVSYNLDNYNLRTKIIGDGIGIQVIHFVGNNRDSLEGPINDLVHVLLQATGPCKAPTYLQEYTCAKKWCQFWEKNGLIVKDEKKGLQVYWADPICPK